MRDLIISIFGEYSPVTYEVFEYDPEGTLRKLCDCIPDGFAGVDWTYVLGVVAFLVVLYSIMRIIGGIITHV